MSATQIATLNTADTTADTTATDTTADTTANGLSFEVHEIEYEDDSVPSVCHGYSSGGGANTFSQQNIPGIQDLEDYDHSPQADSPTSPFPLTRSTSSSLTSPIATATENLPKPSFQCSPTMATADGMFAPPPPPPPPTPAIRTHSNVKRLEFGENPETIATLKFLESQRIDTTALVTQHIMKYGSRARIAQTRDGEVVGFAMFDN